jgi:transposase
VSLEHETDLATLQQAVRLLEQENRKLVRLNLELRQALAEAKGEQVQQLELQIAALEQTLASRNRALFGDSSERRPAEERSEAKEQPASQPQTGHGPRQQDLPIIERVHELDVADRVCTTCGGKLDEWKGQFEESTEIDLLERRFVQLRHKRKKYRCSCGGCIETAPGPLKLIPGGRYSIDIAISTAVAKYADHMPLERLSRALERHGLEVDSQTLWDQINALARVIAPVHDALQAHVLAQPCIGADETHWKVLGGVKGAHGKAKRWQVWAVSAPDAVCYRIKAGRGLEHAADVLGDYRGTVVCDGYSVYESLRKQQRGILLAHCWAHVRRKFFEVEELQPGTCADALDLIGALFDVERRARDAHADGEALLQLRMTESKPIVGKIQQWALAQRALPQSPLRKAVDYMGGLWTGLTTFLERADVPIDNNATERALRGIVLGRKNHFGSRSQRGTEVAALFYSVIETAKLVGADPYDYLRVAAHAALRGEPIPLPQAAA